MTCGTVIDDALATPIFDSFAVHPSGPIPFLHEMTLTTQLITVVEIYLLPLFVHQKVFVLYMMAIDTGQAVFSQAMLDFYITMCKLGGLIDLDNFTVMAPGTLIAFNAPFTGQDFEAASFVFLLGHYHFLADGQG